MDWKAWGVEKVADFLFDKIKEIFFPAFIDNNDLGKNHFIDVIKNGERQDAILVKSERQNFNTHSIVQVMPGEEAVFIDNGIIRGVLEEGRHVLNTSNYPFLSELKSKFAGKHRSYCSSIYFLRTAVSSPIEWGTSLQVRDPIQLIFTRVMCRGIYKTQIIDSQKFIDEFIGNGRERLELKELSLLLQDEIIQYTKSVLTEYIINTEEEIIGISSKQQVLSDKIAKGLKHRFDKYGFKIVVFSITGMDILENNRNRDRIECAYRNKRIRELAKDE